MHLELRGNGKTASPWAFGVSAPRIELFNDSLNCADRQGHFLEYLRNRKVGNNCFTLHNCVVHVVMYYYFEC